MAHEVPRTDACASQSLRVPRFPYGNGIRGPANRNQRRVVRAAALPTTESLVGAAQSVADGIKQKHLAPHFGTDTATAFLKNTVAKLEVNLSVEQVVNAITSALKDVKTLPEHLIPDPSSTAYSPHFGTKAFNDAIQSVIEWAGNGMDPAALQPLISSVKVGLDSLTTESVNADLADAVQSLQESVGQLQEALSSASASSTLSSLMSSSTEAVQAGGLFSSVGSVVLLAAAAVLFATLFMAGNGGKLENDSDVPKRYSPEAIREYFSKRPVLVWIRVAQVSAKAAKFGVALLIDQWTGKVKDNEADRAVQLRNTIEELGPTYVKVAQALSTRVDILTPLYFKEIERLQDRVPTFDDGEAYGAIESDLGKKIPQVFERLSASPVAAASLGQVYRGRLNAQYGGKEVAVKVQRPGVLGQVALDLYVMRLLATTVIKKWQKSRTDYAALIDEWAVRFFQEMDYEQEAVNAIDFRDKMSGLEGIVVPEFNSELCTRRVLVSEWIEGEKLSESSAPDVRELCNTLLNAYLIQLLDTGLLHADPHPGNLIRTPEGKICIIDYGLMTTVQPDQRENLVDYIAKLTTQDWEGVAYALQNLGFIPEGAPDPKTSGLVEPLGVVFSQLVKGGGAKALAKRVRANPGIDKVRQQLEELSKDYPFQVPTFFALILRAFSVIEGIALRVDPEYSIVMECFPYLSKRLLTDNTPRMNRILRGVLYGKKNRLDAERLQSVAAGLRSFTVDGLQKESVRTGKKDGPLLDPTVKEAIMVVFSSRGSYLQELLVDEMVASVDALSREALSRLVTGYLTSVPVSASLRTVEALGPLRGFVLPFATPAEVLTRLQPAIAVTAEDEEALSSVRAILDIVEQLDLVNQAQKLPESRVFGQAAEELSPLVPELLPGIARTGELFVRRLLSRVIMRFAVSLDSSASEFDQSMKALD